MDRTESFRNRQKIKKKEFKVNRNIVRNLLKAYGYVNRKMKKTRNTGEFKKSDRQFKKIARLITQHKNAGNPVVNVDTKKKKRWDNLYRDAQQ
ncbi:MAG: hypothetical protein GXP08_03980 [Gammaproteobacteria bacterium]|nr:hypothetical protein [Gammaproteobacteria bacterium]